MPSCITHQLIAEETRTRLAPEQAHLAERAEDYYFLGAQGADVLFFYRPLCRDNFGRTLHRSRIHEFFCAMLASLRPFRGEDAERALAYSFGYITHYAADVAFHPLVYALLGRDEPHRFAHQQIENDWDVHFARALRGREAERYAFPFSLRKIADEGVLFRLFSRTADKLGRELDGTRFDAALRRYDRYLRFFHGACYRRNRDFARLERALRFDGVSRLFPRRTPDPDALGGEIFESLAQGAKDADELFGRATAESARLVALFAESYLSHAPLPREPFCRHLLTGKPV